MRIADGENPLDATSVHPESYPATMELLKKLELSMEDVRMLQAEAKKGRAAQNTSGADSKNASGDVARQDVSAKGKANRKDRRQNGFNIRNTDTAMGRALAAAMQGMTLDADNGRTDKKGANASGRSGAGALNAANASTGAAAGSSTSGSQKTAAVSALERRIPDKKKAGGRARYRRDHADRYCKGAGKSLPVTPVRICPARSCAAMCWI